jgi:hypothetical protein
MACLHARLKLQISSLVQDATNEDLVVQLDSFESEVVRMDDCVVVAIGPADSDVQELEFQTPAVPTPDGNLAIRLSSTLGLPFPSGPRSS